MMKRLDNHAVVQKPGRLCEGSMSKASLWCQKHSDTSFHSHVNKVLCQFNAFFTDVPCSQKYANNIWRFLMPR